MSAPDVRTVESALDLARRAPSVHNTQPWRWVWDGTTLCLFADQHRWLPATDPGRHGLLMSCGIMLDHVVVAFGAAGWKAEVTVLPLPEEPTLLATLEFTEAEPHKPVLDRARAIPLRHTDRRRYTSWEVPEGLIHVMTERAAKLGVTLVRLEPGHAYRLVEQAIDAAQAERADDAQYAQETALWTGSPVSSDVGVPAGSLLSDPTRLDNRFPAGELTDRPGADNGELLVLVTDEDDDASVITAGRAASAVLLEAAGIGLSTCPLSEPLELPDTREIVSGLLDGGHPHLLIRVGWAPATGAEPAATPRLPLEQVLSVSLD